MRDRYILDFGQGLRRCLVPPLAMLLVAGCGAAPAAPGVTHLSPPSLARLGHSTPVVVVRNGRKVLHIAGQTAINAEFELVARDFNTQVAVALQNLDLALEAGGARRRDIASLHVFFVDRDGAAPRALLEHIHRYFEGLALPAITYVGTPALVGAGMLVEIEGIAVAAP